MDDTRQDLLCACGCVLAHGEARCSTCRELLADNRCIVCHQPKPDRRPNRLYCPRQHERTAAMRRNRARKHTKETAHA